MSLKLDPDDAAFLWETVDNTCLTTKKDQRFYYQTSAAPKETRSGDNQQLPLSAFPTPFLDELFDLGPFINSGIVSPNLAQQLPAPSLLPPTFAHNNHGNHTANVGNSFNGTPATAICHNGDQSSMASQGLQLQDTSLNPNLHPWTASRWQPG
jgi:hypothetical protein